MSTPRLECAVVDELDAAVALDAVTAEERRAIAEHLETCAQPHAEIRALLGAGIVLAAALEPVPPSPALRERVMATVAATPQEHVRVAPARKPTAPPPTRRGWLDWLTPGMSRGLAAVAVAAALLLAVWNVTLQGQVAETDRIQAAIAEARAIFPVTGDAGAGLLLDTPDGPHFLAARLERPPAGSLYQLWLIGPDGVPVDVGIVTDTDGVALVPVERELGDATVFALTVETVRVDAPTSEPVLVASIEP